MLYSNILNMKHYHQNQNITICWNHPKSKNFCLIKQAPFESWHSTPVDDRDGTLCKLCSTK